MRANGKRVILPAFPVRDKTSEWLPAAERRILSDREQKRVAQSTRAALADWFMAISEVATATPSNGGPASPMPATTSA
jgi:hypothetical protein